MNTLKLNIDLQELSNNTLANLMHALDAVNEYGNDSDWDEAHEVLHEEIIKRAFFILKTVENLNNLRCINEGGDDVKDVNLRQAIITIMKEVGYIRPYLPEGSSSELDDLLCNFNVLTYLAATDHFPAL